MKSKMTESKFAFEVAIKNKLPEKILILIACSNTDIYPVNQWALHCWSSLMLTPISPANSLMWVTTFSPVQDYLYVTNGYDCFRLQWWQQMMYQNIKKIYSDDKNKNKMWSKVKTHIHKISCYMNCMYSPVHFAMYNPAANKWQQVSVQNYFPPGWRVAGISNKPA